MTETLACGYSSESTQRELSDEYQNDRVWMIFKNLCMLVLWMKVASALEGFRGDELCVVIMIIIKPSNAEATFVQSTRMQRLSKTI